MKFEAVPGCKMIIRCGHYTIEKTPGDTVVFYGAWYQPSPDHRSRKKIPCAATRAACEQACVSHKVRAGR